MVSVLFPRLLRASPHEKNFDVFDISAAKYCICGQALKQQRRYSLEAHQLRDNALELKVFAGCSSQPLTASATG